MVTCPAQLVSPIRLVLSSSLPLEHEIACETLRRHCRSPALAADSPTEILSRFTGSRLSISKKPFQTSRNKSSASLAAFKESTVTQEKRGGSMKQYPWWNGQARREGCLKNRMKALRANARRETVRQWSSMEMEQEGINRTITSGKRSWSIFSWKSKHTSLQQSQYHLPMY